MKYIRLFLVILLSCVAVIRPVAASDEKCAVLSPGYRDELLSAGFPESYLPMLASLHEKHPGWHFRAHDVTSLSPVFTWSYCVSQMMSDPARNLVIFSLWAPEPFSAYGDANYAPYRDESLGTFDSGIWYAATEQAVCYFLDPRNFLNDTDIFQFLDWSYDGTPAISDEQLETVLVSSYFSCRTLPVPDGVTTYASFLNRTSSSFGIHPLFAAARLVMENGAGDSPMVRGNAGDVLGIPAYNGLYNLFNIGAGGTGYTEIYTNGMKEALAGTPEMADAWGGSPAWDTPWKALYGGICKLKTNYVSRYKNTLYLQKFNTDPRGVNTFSGYMQNIAAPLIEGRKFRSAVCSAGTLDASYTFTIPVYTGMPEHVCADPGGGRLYYSPTETPVTAYTLAESPLIAQTDGRSLTVSCTRETDGAAVTLIAASFDGQRMTDVRAVDVSEPMSKTFDFSNTNGDTYRVFLLDGHGIPLCESLSGSFGYNGSDKKSNQSD